MADLIRVERAWRRRYRLSVAIGYLVHAFLYLRFVAGGPLPPRDWRTRIRDTATLHADEAVIHLIGPDDLTREDRR